MAPDNEGVVLTEVDTLGHVLGLMEAFRSFDSDNDGLITMEELACVMGSLGYYMSVNEASSIMQQNDKNNDGLLTLPEFLDFNTKDMDLGSMAMYLRLMVQDSGMDANDVITGDELFKVIHANGMGLPITVCQHIIGSMDGDGDGAVSFEDFQLIVNALL